jgi:hypothetical protein
MNCKSTAEILTEMQDELAEVLAGMWVTLHRIRYDQELTRRELARLSEGKDVRDDEASR